MRNTIAGFRKIDSLGEEASLHANPTISLFFHRPTTRHDALMGYQTAISVRKPTGLARLALGEELADALSDSGHRPNGFYRISTHEELGETIGFTEQQLDETKREEFEDRIGDTINEWEQLKQKHETRRAGVGTDKVEFSVEREYHKVHHKFKFAKEKRLDYASGEAEHRAW